MTNNPLNEPTDSVQKIQDEKFNPVELEDRFVHQVYERIASDFSSTRHSPWPSVIKFIQSQSVDALGADIGCGNGKYLLASSKSSSELGTNIMPIIALERSRELACIVRDRGFDVIMGDILRLPICSERVDFFICIAVLHHLSTVTRRTDAIKELARILHKGGQGLIQVWAREQHDPNKDHTASYYVSHRKNKLLLSNPSNEELKTCETVPGLFLPVHKPGTEFPLSDMLVPWKSKQNKCSKNNESQTNNQNIDATHGRYYHLFVKGELEDLINQIPSLRIDKSFYEQGNWVVHVSKIL